MLRYHDEPDLKWTAAWLNHAVLAVSVGLNALFIFHSLHAEPIRAEENPLLAEPVAAHSAVVGACESETGSETLIHREVEERLPELEPELLLPEIETPASPTTEVSTQPAVRATPIRL
ncbi:MAG: hypothetical protein AAF658_10570 [Myxococcota bacterium]